MPVPLFHFILLIVTVVNTKPLEIQLSFIHIPHLNSLEMISFFFNLEVFCYLLLLFFPIIILKARKSNGEITFYPASLIKYHYVLLAS